jgi:hypothetical protein
VAERRVKIENWSNYSEEEEELFSVLLLIFYWNSAGKTACSRRPSPSWSMLLRKRNDRSGNRIKEAKEQYSIRRRNKYVSMNMEIKSRTVSHL